MAIEYFLFIFFASVGVIQITAAWRRLDFALFLRNRSLTFIFAFLVIMASYHWFFFLNARNAGDTGDNIQLPLFPAAILLSTAFTLFLSSIINAGRNKKGSKIDVQVPREGIEVLKEMTYWQAVRLISLPKDK